MLLSSHGNTGFKVVLGNIFLNGNQTGISSTFLQTSHKATPRSCFPVPCSSPCYTVILMAHSPAVPWPSSLLSPESSQGTAPAQSPHQHTWGFATAPGFIHIPQQAAPYHHHHQTHQRCCAPRSTQASLTAAHSISQTLIKSCAGHAGLVWKVILTNKMETKILETHEQCDCMAC